jgi:hypothetical protein
MNVITLGNHDLVDDKVLTKAPKHVATGSSSSRSRSGSGNKALDDLLGSKLNRMSLEERSNGLHDLHGVADIEEETTEMLRAKLNEMNQALAAAASHASSSRDVRAYQKAIAMRPEYVWRLKLPCLRAERYNSQEAARRLLRFFDRKLELFGEARLVRDITRDELNEDENDALEQGLFQVLPDRDRAGRAILFIDGMVNASHSTTTVVSPLS